jgi:hypothetical protein
MLVLPDGKAVITFWSLVSIVTCWEAAKFSAHPRVDTSVDIPYGIKANKRQVVKHVCVTNVCFERNQHPANERGIRVAKLSDRHLTQPKYHAEGRRKENEKKITFTPKYRSMKAFCDSGGIAPRIFNFGSCSQAGRLGERNNVCPSQETKSNSPIFSVEFYPL